MNNADWISLFRQLPTDVHNILNLVLQNKTEIVVETIYRLEPTFAVIRGRIGGNIESGMLFMVPYNQLSSLYLSKEVTDEDMQRIFGGAHPVATVNGHAKANSSHPDGAPAKSNGSHPGTSAPPTVAAPETTSLRSNLLERLRAARQAVTNPANGK